MFNDDSPRRNIYRDDRLGVRSFAEHLTDAVLSIDNRNGYVVGLHGTWGSGKTTVFNFVRQLIENKNYDIGDSTKQTLTIDFQPWLVSEHQDLIGAFFKILSEEFRQYLTTNSARRWGMKAAKYADPAIEAAAKIGAMFDPTGGIGTKAVGAVLQRGLNEQVEKWKSVPSLQTSYELLASTLLKQRRKIIVTIDDVDRLSADEIRHLMKMIKSVGRLPYITYARL